MTDPIELRVATLDDVPAILAIYAPYVTSTTVSFESVPPSEQEFGARVAKSLSSWQWLVAQSGGEVVGYAYGSAHRERHAYRFSTEVSVYVAPNFQQRGVARALYERLFVDLAALGYCNAYAGITLPNEPSVAFHTRLGFEPIGVFRRVGRKFGAWHDVAWLQRTLRDAPIAD